MNPIVNESLWGYFMENQTEKIQARYFWSNVLEMEDAEEDMLKKINIKMINGLQKS